MIEEIVEEILRLDKQDKESVRKVLINLPLEKFPPLVERLINEEKRKTGEYYDQVENLTEQAQCSSHSMEDYYDNEVRVAHQGMRKEVSEIDSLINLITEIKQERVKIQ